MKLSELAKKHGHYHTPHVSEDQPFDADHAVAAVYHKWNVYQKEAGAELELSDEDYLLALESAKQGKVHAKADPFVAPASEAVEAPAIEEPAPEAVEE